MPAPTSESKLRPSERIIVALDVETADNAQRIVDELGDSVGGFKIGLQLFTSAGPELVRNLAGKGHRVFLDLKFHDIPNTVAKASVEAARLGAWMFNVHASGGGEMMKRTANKVGEVCERESLTPPKIIAVTVLTSSDNNLLAETGIEGDVENQVVKLAQLTAKYGLDGVVASALEAATVKANVPQPFLVVTPGIRSASATKDDQKRVTTAEEAVLNGADYLVIGRPITQAANKREAALAIANQIPEISDRSPV